MTNKRPIHLKIHNPYYVSRSMLQTGKECERRLLYNYLWDGIGLTSDEDSIPLTTGDCVHKGPEHLFNQILKGKLTVASKPEWIMNFVNEAVQVACVAYERVLSKVTYGTSKQAFHKEHFEFLKKEQMGITEALVRAWAYQELPIILNRYVVVSAEKNEINSLMDWKGVEVRLQTRADAVLKKKDTRDTFVYSLKTTKKFSDWDMKSYSRNPQVNTEMWGVDKWLEGEEKFKHAELLRIATLFKKVESETAKTLLTDKFKKVQKQHVSKHVMGIRFCYLVKGDRKDELNADGNSTGKWVTYNPFIRGYKKINISSIDYSSSWITTKPNNKSGYGTLGKGWEPFYIWDEGFTIKKWMSKIKKGEVLPKDRSIIKEHVVVPAEVFRNQDRQVDVLGQLIEQVDVNILSKIKRCIDYGLDPEKVFTQTLTACIYPSTCQFINICDRGEVRANPEMHGFTYRTPHHPAELVQLEGLKEKIKEGREERKERKERNGEVF